MSRFVRPTVLLVALCATLAAGAHAQTSAVADSVQVEAAPAPVRTLTNYDSFAAVMDLARGTVRLVAVISPSSPDAETSIGVIKSILQSIPSKRLRAYVVLSNAGNEDSGARAIGFVARHRDRRIIYMWDPQSSVASAMGPVVGIGSAFAFETYYLFETDATFTGKPATPALWMEMSPYIEGTPLSAGPLHDRAAGMVRTVEEKAAEATSPQP